MKNQILNELKTKFEGVSEQILDRIATKMATTITNEEQIKSSVDDMTLQRVIESYADSRATQATQTAVHNYEQKYGLKDGKAITTITNGGNTSPQPDKGGNNPTEQILQQLLEQNKRLSERLDSMDRAKTATDRRQQISVAVEPLPESLRKVYSRYSVDNLNDEEFNGLINEIKTEAGNIATELQQKGAIFGKPTANNGGNNSKELTKEQQDAISQRNGSVNGEGQPF